MSEQSAGSPRSEVPRVGDVGFADLMDLNSHGPDTFVGLAPRYPWGRLFGGQVVAQALRAAQLTVPEEYSVHSLHAYFVRGGTHREPVRLEVDRMRNGRSFVNRTVVARQSTGAILNLSCSFQVAEDEADVQTATAPLSVPGPDEAPDTGWGDDLVRRRAVVNDHGHTVTWIRLNAEGIDDPALISCGIAFLSDTVPTGAVRSAHPIQVPRERVRDYFVGASLDHVVYFLRPPTTLDGWLLADVVSHGLVGGRGVSVGSLFDSSGRQLSTIVQEVLLRERRDRTGGEAGLSGKEI